MFLNFVRKYLLRKNNKVFIRSNCNFEKTIFMGRNKIGRNTDVKESFIGFGTYIGDDCYLRQCKIGKYCSIGSWIKVVTGKHPLNYVLTHPISFNDSLKKLGLSSKKSIPFKEAFEYVTNNYYIEIGNDVWIGQSVEILSGIRISDGAVIAAGAVVTENIGPYEVWGGVPAKLIKKRFNEEEIRKLLDLKIWDKDLKWIQENADKLSDIKNFI